ncbi:MAG: prepilin-type N-terminal cleavage/methylation domain-containing protein [Pseudomonadota bacterium]
MTTRRAEGGFTLLEVLVAMAVLAVGLLAVTTAQQSSMHNAMRVYRGQVAALLMRGIVMDIEEEYRVDGFPENTVTHDCDLPSYLEKTYECEYELERMDLDMAQMTDLVDASFGGLLGEGGLGELQAGGDLSSTMEGLVGGQSQVGGMDMAGLAFLLPVLGPEGQAIMDLCGVRLEGLIMGFMGMQTLVPMILNEVGNRTRKLVVRISWKDGPVGSRTFEVTTFLSMLPEEQLKDLKDLEDAKDVMDQLPAGTLPGLGGSGSPVAPGGSPRPSGGGGR